MKHVLTYYLTCVIVSASVVHAAEDYIDVVITDSPEYTFETQFRALALQPHANNIYYAAEAFPLNTAIATPLVSPNWKIYDLHPSFYFAFDLGFRGIFHTRNTALFANWQHFKSCTCAITPVVSTEQFPDPMVGPFSSIGPDAAPYNVEAQGRVIFHFDEVNVRYGQFVEFGNYLQTNIFAGVSFARIEQCLESTYIGSGDIAQTITSPTSFIGAGPQIGVDFAYDIANCFSFTGQAAGALLIGTAKNHTTYASLSPVLVALGDPSPNIQSTSVQNITQMVPSFSERLAFAYFFDLRDCYSSKIEVGFEAKIFLSALQSTNLASGVIDVAPFGNTVGVFARTFERTIGNFSLSGPYVAFTVAF